MVVPTIVSHREAGSSSPEVVIPSSAAPPWHTVAILMALIGIFIQQIPNCCWMLQVQLLPTAQQAAGHDGVDMNVSFEKLNHHQQSDDVNKSNINTMMLDALVGRASPMGLSPFIVGICRIVIALIILADVVYALLFGEWDQDTDYFPGSKLVRVYGIPFRGYFQQASSSHQKQPTTRSTRRSWWVASMTLSSFTMWVWTLEGITFLLMGLTVFSNTTLADDQQGTSEAKSSSWNFWVQLLTVALWHIVAPCSLLISVIVSYALWPMALRDDPNGNNAMLLKHPGALLEHNFNVLATLIERALIGGLPIQWYQYPWAPSLGLLYVFFSYGMMYTWGKLKQQQQQYGPQFIYPFLDTTLGLQTSLSMVCLLTVLLVSHAVFSWVSDLMFDRVPTSLVRHLWDTDDDGAVHVVYLFVSIRILIVLIVANSVCRFRD